MSCESAEDDPDVTVRHRPLLGEASDVAIRNYSRDLNEFDVPFTRETSLTVCHTPLSRERSSSGSVLTQSATRSVAGRGIPHCDVCPIDFRNWIRLRVRSALFGSIAQSLRTAAAVHAAMPPSMQGSALTPIDTCKAEVSAQMERSRRPLPHPRTSCSLIAVAQHELSAAGFVYLFRCLFIRLLQLERAREENTFLEQELIMTKMSLAESEDRYQEMKLLCARTPTTYTIFRVMQHSCWEMMLRRGPRSAAGPV